MKGLSCKFAGVHAAWLTVLVTLVAMAEARPGALLSLREATLQAFLSYVVKTEAQNAESLRHGPFLWVDSLQDKDRIAAMAKLRRGEVQLRRLSVNGAGGNLDVPGGMIHDWEGIISFPA